MQGLKIGYMIIKIYSFKDFFNNPLTSDLCELEIIKILASNTRIHWFKFLHEIAKKIKFWNQEDILKLQKEIFQKGFPRKIVLNRRAVLVITQFLFSIKKPRFSIKDKPINSKDTTFLFLIINEYLDLKETLKIRKSLKKQLFFSTFKTIHTSYGAADIMIMHYFFEKFYQKITRLKQIDVYNKQLQKEIGYDHDSFNVFLNSLINGTISKSQFQDLKNISSINYDDIDALWQNRTVKLEIPFEYNFLENFPLVNENGIFYLYDHTNLFVSLIRKEFSVLANYNSADFRHEFGQDIAEPIIQEELTNMFQGEGVKIIKVSTKNYQYGDFGVCLDDKLLLFEIKSVYFKSEIRYSNNYEYFISSFNGKFVKKHGVEQQVRRVIDIDVNYEHFRQLTNLPDKKYTIYPIILSFDDSVQSIGCNWYINNRYAIYKKLLIKKISHIKVSDTTCIISFNELKILNDKFSRAKEKAEKILEFIKRKPDIFSFREFIETKRPNIKKGKILN